MAIDGRINVDVLFHDTDGTASLKVVSLEDSTAYTTGKVAIVTGTVGTALLQINVAPIPQYKNAAGNNVLFSNFERFCFAATGSLTKLNNDDVTVTSAGGRACISDVTGLDDVFRIQTTAGTASYTLVVYGP